VSESNSARESLNELGFDCDPEKDAAIALAKWRIGQCLSCQKSPHVLRAGLCYWCESGGVA